MADMKQPQNNASGNPNGGLGTAQPRTAQQQAQLQAMQQAAIQQEAARQRAMQQAQAQQAQAQAAAQQRARQQAQAQAAAQQRAQQQAQAQAQAAARQKAQQEQLAKERAAAQQRQMAQRQMELRRLQAEAAERQRAAQAAAQQQAQAAAQQRAQQQAAQQAATQQRAQQQARAQAAAQQRAQQQAQSQAAAQQRARVEAAAQAAAQQRAQQQAAAQAAAQKRAQQQAAQQAAAQQRAQQAAAQQRAQQVRQAQQAAQAAAHQRALQQQQLQQEQNAAQQRAQQLRQQAQQADAVQKQRTAGFTALNAEVEAMQQKRAADHAREEQENRFAADSTELAAGVGAVAAQALRRKESAKKAVKEKGAEERAAKRSAKRQARANTKAGKAASRTMQQAEEEAKKVAEIAGAKAAEGATVLTEKAAEGAEKLTEKLGVSEKVDIAKIKGKTQYFIHNMGPAVEEIKADPYKKDIAIKVLIIVLAILLSFRLTSIVNDIMGFSRSDKNVTFTISQDDMTTNQIIGRLDRKGIIKHSWECKAFIMLTNGVRNTDEATYLKGDYVLQKNMGIEKMLIQCMNIQKRETVEVSIPEGYCVDQIGEALEKSKVCSKEDFVKACHSANYSFDFLEAMPDQQARYCVLEGYLYPDTYEFYIGQDAEAVVSKMLGNFNAKWSDAYAARAKELNMSLDDVLTMASIIQKEDSKPANMAYIASVFYNRLNSASFPSLQSDATVNYVKEYIKPYVSEANYQTYNNAYSTYVCKGLPIGPICNAGDDAIKSVLWPETTGYYFFAHDDNGQLYLARTANEQNANVYKAAQSAAKKDE